MGMVATGKSCLARALAKRLGCRHYNSDVIRKEITGTLHKNSSTLAMDEGIYSSEISEKTYNEILKRAMARIVDFAASFVILDASYLQKKNREKLCLAFHGKGKIMFFHCSVSKEVVKRRLVLRAHDHMEVSDGRWEVYLEQKKRFEYPAELSMEQLVSLDTDMPVSVLVDICLAHLDIEAG